MVGTHKNKQVKKKECFTKHKTYCMPLDLNHSFTSYNKVAEEALEIHCFKSGKLQL